MTCGYALLVIVGIVIALFLIVGLVFKREVKACFERDPAAVNFLEVLLTYSGLHAIIYYRVANRLRRAGIPFLPRVMSQFARFMTGIEIHPGATIGEGLFIDHGMGVVIGETSVIGRNVTIFQGVTLGGTGKERGKRHPTIGDNVVIGTGAKVLGNIKVGDNVQIGANAVVIRDVPDNATVVGVPGRIARKEGRKILGINLDHTKLPDPLTQALDRLQKEIDLIETKMKDWHREQEER
jgi:serine O-acetyltransferase